MTNSPLTVSLIVPAVNEAESITRAVEAGWKAGADEVIVVDGGSEDDTREFAEKANATVLTSERGRAKQQNLGADAATGDVLLFQHADNWCDTGACQQIRDALADEKIDGGAFRQFIVDPRFRFRVIEWGIGQ